MNSGAYWSNESMVFYIILGLYAIWTVQHVKFLEIKTNNKNNIFFNRYILLFTIFLTIFYAFRLVNQYVGGADAPSYIFFFEECNNPTYADHEWFLHNDFLFRYFTKFLRLFSDDYHFYFIIIGGFNIYICILFLLEFCNKKSNYIPCLLLVFLYWRSMSSIRSNTASAVFMLSIILLHRQYIKTAIILGISSFFFHKMAGIYVLFFPFYYVFTNFKMNRSRFFVLLFAVISLGTFIQTSFLDYAKDFDFGEHYSSYVIRSADTSFWDNTWKIAFEQMLLGVFILFNYRNIQNQIRFLNKIDSGRLRMIWLLCIFDMMTIPVNSILGSWRGYEFLYMARIVMWCEILYLANKTQAKSFVPVLNTFFLVAFVAWMVFRFYSMWETSNLMPYIFEPLTNM